MYLITTVIKDALGNELGRVSHTSLHSQTVGSAFEGASQWARNFLSIIGDPDAYAEHMIEAT